MCVAFRMGKGHIYGFPGVPVRCSSFDVAMRRSLFHRVKIYPSYRAGRGSTVVYWFRAVVLSRGAYCADIPRVRVGTRWYGYRRVKSDSREMKSPLTNFDAELLADRSHRPAGVGRQFSPKADGRRMGRLLVPLPRPSRSSLCGSIRGGFRPLDVGFGTRKRQVRAPRNLRRAFTLRYAFLDPPHNCRSVCDFSMGHPPLSFTGRSDCDSAMVVITVYLIECHAHVYVLCITVYLFIVRISC